MVTLKTNLPNADPGVPVSKKKLCLFQYFIVIPYEVLF